MASISKPLGVDKNGKKIYQVSWREPGGKQRHKKVHGEDEARLFRAQIELQLLQGKYTSVTNMTLSEYIFTWIEREKRSKKYKTFLDYQLISTKHILPTLGKMKLKDVKAFHLRNYLLEKKENGRLDGKPGGLHPTTLKKHMRTLHLIFECAKQDDLIAENPVDRLDFSQIVTPAEQKARKRQMIVLSRAEIQELLSLANGTPLHLPVAIALMTGARLGEVLALKWTNINLKSRIANITENLQRQKNEAGTSRLVFTSPKSGPRCIALPGYLVELLKQEKKAQAERKRAWGTAYEDYDLVCCQDNGRPWEPSNISNKFRKLVDASNLPRVRYHDLRHTFLTILAEELRIGLNTVALQAGHADPGFTSRTYIHSNVAALVGAADAYNNYLFDQGNDTSPSIASQ